ncbi:MAG: hypothetical protein J0G30_09490, partial [Actinomycetales bacterium]|nr:hypothetical protein [Actinomycetales bacterium]
RDLGHRPLTQSSELDSTTTELLRLRSRHHGLQSGTIIAPTQVSEKPGTGHIHIALVVALLGVAGTLMNVLQLGSVFAGTAERPAAVLVSTITFLLLIVYIALGVRSFVVARRWRREQRAAD